MKKLFAALCATALLSTSAFAQQWSTDQINKFSTMLYDAGRADGNWEGHLTDAGLRTMTDCIASYYSESITFEVALEYYETMPPEIQREFNFVLTKCHLVAKDQENTFI